jgi:uncharacterized membrane protein (UPF0127 family)
MRIKNCLVPLLLAFTVVLTACNDNGNGNSGGNQAANPPQAVQTNQAPSQPENLPPPPSAGQPQSLPTIDLHIDNAVLHTEIASTGQERETGLMYVTQMPDNDGMIFLMPGVGPATFWMKNTLIPLSVAFIDSNGVILDIHDMQPADPNARDQDIPLTHSDTDKTAYSLETNLHWFALNGIKPGDKITPPPSTWGTVHP